MTDLPGYRVDGAAAALAARKFGGRIVELESAPSVSNTAAQYVAGDPERVLLTVVNLSANSIYIGFRPDVSPTNGILLGPNGGSITLDAEQDAVLVTRQVFAIGDGASSATYRLQLRRDTGLEPDDPFDASF